MTRRVSLRGPAQRDLYLQLRYFEKESRRLQRRFAAASQRALDYLLRWPYAGSVWETDDPAYRGLRVWRIRGFENHLIFYRPLPEGIEVLRVLQGSRDLETIFGPDPNQP